MNAQSPAKPQDAAMSTVKYRLTFGVYNQASDWTDRRELTWPELTKILTTHEVGSKEGTCLVPAIFYGGKRKKMEAERIDVVFLDSDAGFTLQEIEAAVRQKGWAAVISSTHSHLTTRTKVKRQQWEKYLANLEPEVTEPHAAFLEDDKGYLSRIAEGARLTEEEGEYVFFEHQPCPKFRVALPLAKPWISASFPKQATANAEWKERIEILAGALRLHHDQSCVDSSRLFYLPRRAEDAPPAETVIIEGAPCDIFALDRPDLFAPQEEKPKAKRKGKKAASADDLFEFTDPKTGEVVDLSRWNRRFGARFQIVDALRASSPGQFTGLVTDGIKHHIRCPNEDEHTNAGQDAATFITNASAADVGMFMCHCRHGHCTGKHTLFFLRRMLAQGWLSVGDLTKKSNLLAEAVDGESAPADAADDEETHYHQPPLIRYVAGELPNIVTQAEDALIRSSIEIYQRGSFIVRPGVTRIEVRGSGEAETVTIMKVGSHALVEEMTRAADWEAYDGRSEEFVRINAPRTVADTLMERCGHWRLPVLAGIITAPTLRPDGSILEKSGYDKATGLRLDLRGRRVPKLREDCTKDHAEKALKALEGLLRNFPFVNGESRSVALSAILTAVIRRSLPTAPLHAFTAPTAASGKSLLVDIASLIASGHEAPVIAQGKTEEEMEKRISSLLLDGSPIIAIDNCEAPLGGDILLTCPLKSGPPLM